MDIGSGTQDILIYQPDRPLEASFKLVLPSPAVIAADKIHQAAHAGRDVWLYGNLMGGGRMTEAVQAHLEAGLKVYAQKKAALSLHDDLAKVEALGVILTESKPEDTTPIKCGDVDLSGLAHALDHFGLPLPGRYAVAGQDHGFEPHSSNRVLRFAMWEEFLERGGRLADLAYTEPPQRLTRLKALSEVLPGAVVADTASAALAGALQDEAAVRARDEGVTIVNVGNGHTVAFLVKGDRVTGVYEHHTSLLDPDKLADHLARFKKGELSNDEVMDGFGHGCRVNLAGEYATTVITGPQREMAHGLGKMAVVHGDMMLSGCFGLLELARLIGELKD